MRNITYHPGGEFIPNPKPFFTIENECAFCGRQTRTAIDKDTEYDRAEAEHWKRRYEMLMGNLNSMIKYLETETGWNPYKERWTKMMIKIRNELLEDE